MEKKNNIDPQYNNLLKDILENGIKKQTRNGEVLSVFGRQIRHKMLDGFPLLTCKKMYFKGIVTELLWFLRGDINIKYLVDNDCHIWDGDAHKNYIKETIFNSDNKWLNESDGMNLGTGEQVKVYRQYSKEEFINKIKTDDEFAQKWGDLGPIYGKQWRKWRGQDGIIGEKDENGTRIITWNQIDQIQNLINDLKTNPDSRRLMVNAWNVGEIDNMVLPPCHYGFQCWTRELTWEEQVNWVMMNTDVELENLYIVEEIAKESTPKRAISLMWNQRSVDTFLGLPFNIASYGLLLEILAKECNMVADELIGNLGDTHIYLNHIEAVEEQLKKEPYPLSKLNIKLHFKNNPSFTPEYWLVEDFELINYQSHSSIKAQLNN